MAVRISRRALLATPLATLFTTGVTTGLAGCVNDDWAAFPATDLSVATGNPGGVFARYGEALSTVLERRLDGVTSRTRLTDASVENLRMVHDGTCDLGFSLGDTASDAVRGTGDFPVPLDVVALARTYDSFVHLVVRADSSITEPRDLRGRRVGLGAGGSGTRVVAERVLELGGVDQRDIEVRTDPLEDSADALVTGDLDAFFFVSGLPNQAVAELSRRIPVRLLTLRDMVPLLVEEFGPEYVDGPIPASTYRLPSAVDTVSVKNYVVVARSMPADLGYAVTRVMFEAQAAIDRLAPGVRQPTLGAAVFTSPLPLHPGALRYYREQRA
jgi:TRAP transporter TAXI family solute receptor